MADKEVADLTSAGTLDGTESFHLLKSGNSRKSLLSAVLTYIQGGIFGTFGLAFAGNEDAAAARGDLGLEDTSTDNTVVRFDGTAGQTQSSGVVVDDSNNVSGVGTLSMGDALTISEHATAPSTPASGKAVIYANTDGFPFSKNDSGAAYALANERTPVDLSDGATPALDASLGNVFRLSAAGDRTIAVPSNPKAGQKIIIRHLASGGARTLALNTGTGGFRYGTDVTGLTQTVSGKVDYIGCVYDATDNKWDVIAYSKGY